MSVLSFAIHMRMNVFLSCTEPSLSSFLMNSTSSLVRFPVLRAASLFSPEHFGQLRDPALHLHHHARYPDFLVLFSAHHTHSQLSSFEDAEGLLAYLPDNSPTLYKSVNIDGTVHCLIRVFRYVRIQPFREGCILCRTRKGRPDDRALATWDSTRRNSLASLQ